MAQDVNKSTMSQNVHTPVQLYRYLMRVIKRLPPPVQDHYRHHVRQSFHSHGDEDDEERVRQIIDRAVQDSQWLLEKHSKK